MEHIYLPYLLDYTNLTVEGVTIFCVAVLIAILVSAEGQAFGATLLGDSQPGARDRFHFNVFMHLDILGTLSFFVAGFGWAKEVRMEKGDFSGNCKGLRLVMGRLSGPFANLLMANIAASLAWILSRWGFVDTVFSTIAVVNVSMAVYSLLLIPPLPGASLIAAVVPEGAPWKSVRVWAWRIGPFLLVGGFLLIRLSGWTGIGELMNPIVETLVSLIVDF